MKKYLNIILVTLLLAGIIAGCKKNSAKNYVASIKNKVWWGMFTYTGKTPEYYCIQFNSDNSLVWSQWSGDFPGKWALDNKSLTLTVTFIGNTVTVKADIADDDDRLVNITDNTGASDINSGKLLAVTNVSLDNTTWKGQNFTFNFKPASALIVEVAGSPYGPYPYTRFASGAVIRSVSDQLFGIIVSGSEMKGSYNAANNQWELIKQ